MTPLDLIFGSILSFLEELFALIFSFVANLEGLDGGEDELED
jgi:hypothetical protein